MESGDRQTEAQSNFGGTEANSHPTTVVASNTNAENKKKNKPLG